MKVEFSASPKAFSGNVAAFVAADKQLLAAATAIDGAGGVSGAIGASRFTGAKNQTLAVLGQPGLGRLLLLGVGKPRELDARTAESLGGLIVADANASGQKSVTVVVDAVKGSRLTPGQIAGHIALGAQLRTSFLTSKTMTFAEALAGRDDDLPGRPRRARAGSAAVAAIDAVFFTRTGEQPPTNPIRRVRVAKAHKLGVKVQIMGEAELKKLGMNVLLALAKAARASRSCWS